MNEELEKKVFEDCCMIADKYNTNLLCVLDIYNKMEDKYKMRKDKHDHSFILKHVEEYYRRLKK